MSTEINKLKMCFDHMKKCLKLASDKDNNWSFFRFISNINEMPENVCESVLDVYGKLMVGDESKEKNNRDNRDELCVK